MRAELVSGSDSQEDKSKLKNKTKIPRDQIRQARGSFALGAQPQRLSIREAPIGVDSSAEKKRELEATSCAKEAEETKKPPRIRKPPKREIATIEQESKESLFSE